MRNLHPMKYIATIGGIMTKHARITLENFHTFNESNLDELPELLSVTEVALLMRVSAPTVRKWIRQQTLPAITLPSNSKNSRHRIPTIHIKKLLLTANTSEESTSTPVEKQFSALQEEHTTSHPVETSPFEREEDLQYFSL